MIQRIQSVFLFASFCFLVPMFFSPVFKLIYGSGEILDFNLTGFYLTEMGITRCISQQYSILAFGVLICALNLVTIFMHKRRVLQLRLCIYNIILLVGFAGILLYTVYGVPDVNSVLFRLPSVFPVVAIILHYLAFRGIRRDELMVQALSRLR